MPKAIAASICSEMRFNGTRSASWAPWTTKRPASTGVSSRRTCATQSRSSSFATAKGRAPALAASRSSATSSGRPS